MGSIIENVDPWLIALTFGIAMISAWGFGWWRGQKQPPEPGQDPGVKFTDSTMALLGLLLGFTFSMSLSRHDQRRAMVVAESNSINDFYTCASLLKGTQRTELLAAIREYAQAKLAITQKQLTEQEFEAAMKRVSVLIARMTEWVDHAVSEGTPVVVPLTNSLNALVSSNASRLAAYRDRLPCSILTLLFLSSIVPAFLMGRQQGAAPHVHISGTVSFIFLVTAVLFVTLDLNLPASGTITVSQEPMTRLIDSMQP